MGRGVETFSISRAMALASNTPTQMGRTMAPLISLRITMGMLDTGSIINPRIFISTSIASSSVQLHHSLLSNAFTYQRVGPRPRHAYGQILAHQRDATGIRVIEVQ